MIGLFFSFPQKHKSPSLPTHSHPSTQILRNSRKLLQRRLQILNNAGSKHIRGSQRICPFQALITQPEEIKAHLVALEKFLIAKRAEALALLSLVTILCMVTRHKIIQMSPRQRI